MAEQRTIRSPCPGTFYRQPSPQAAPYVTEGDRLIPGNVVGLVEIMKNFIEIKSEEVGIVERFLVENEDPVEAGQDIVLLGE